MGNVGDCCDCTEKNPLVIRHDKQVEREDMFTRVERFDVLMFEDDLEDMHKDDELVPLVRRSENFEISCNTSFNQSKPYSSETT